VNLLSKITVVAIGILAGMYLSGCGSDNTSLGEDTGVGSCITHNSTEYCDVTSPYTGKIWLNKNLGAARVCTAYNDTECYGDYYQWGRKHDGHQDKNSEITSIQAEDVYDAGREFVINNEDWASVDSDGSGRSVNWSKTDGNYACPAGYRVPTKDELKTETTDQGVSNKMDAFNSFLKLPSGGFRYGDDGDMFGQGSFGNVWSSSSFLDNTSYLLLFESDDAFVSAEYRSWGQAVRCIKN
jgi:uncharacterized protein (TIGR02145 family)